MSNNQARDLFQLQSELIDTKVDMAVSKAIDRVIDQIRDLRSEMHTEFSDLGERVASVESSITYIKETQSKISTKLIEYTFRAIWLILGSAIFYIIANFFKLSLFR